MRRSARLDLVEELDGEAQRVDDADGVADAVGALALLHPLDRAAEFGEELLRLVDVLRGADAVGEVVQGGDVALAQHQGVVGQFVGAAQVQRLGVLVLDVEAEHVDPEPAGRAEVGDGELGVGGADDVGCRGVHEAAPKRGVWTSPRATWTIFDSV